MTDATPRVTILIYQSYLPFQGRYPRVSGQAEILQRHGYDVQVLACDREARHPVDETVEGIRVRRIPIRSGEMLGPIRQLIPLILFFFRATGRILRERPDILICHNLDVVPIGCAIRCFSRTRVFFDAHEPNYYGLWPEKWRLFHWGLTLSEKLMARMMHGITVTNGYQVRKYTGFGVRHVAMIGNFARPDFGIDTIPQEKRERDTVTFGRLGTIYPGTGFEQMVQAFQKVQQDRAQARLLIAGRVVDKYRDRFEQIIAPIADRIERIGAYAADQMPELYRQLDVSLMIYPRNAWFRHITPTKYYDSLANGVPVIMTDIGGIGDEIRHEQCGLVVDENDIDEIADAMRQLIDEPERRLAMAQQALEATRTSYSWEAMERDYVAFIADVSGHFPAGRAPQQSSPNTPPQMGNSPAGAQS